MSWYTMISHHYNMRVGQDPLSRIFLNLSPRICHFFTTRDSVFYSVIVYPNGSFADLSRLVPESADYHENAFCGSLVNGSCEPRVCETFYGSLLGPHTSYHIISYHIISYEFILSIHLISYHYHSLSDLILSYLCVHSFPKGYDQK